MNNKVSEAQKRAKRKWEENNREKSRIDGYKRTARLFIKKHANEEDIEEFNELIEIRKRELKGEKLEGEKHDDL